MPKMNAAVPTSKRWRVRGYTPTDAKPVEIIVQASDWLAAKRQVHNFFCVALIDLLEE